MENVGLWHRGKLQKNLKNIIQKGEIFLIKPLFNLI